VLSACATIDAPPQRVRPVVHVPAKVEVTSVIDSPGFYHTVVPGDTVWKIVKKYDVAFDEVVSRNRLPNESHLDVGQMIFVPGKKARAVRTPEQLLAKKVTTELRFQWPVRGNVVRQYQERFNGVMNRGIDIQVLEGTEVCASKSGVVAYAGNSVLKKGNMIVIEHQGDFQSVYAYNAKNIVKKGEFVSQGQVIAYVGRTGNVSTPALHFELRRRTRPVNPLEYLPIIEQKYSV